MEIVFTIGIMAFLGIMTFFTLGMAKETLPGDVFGAGGFPLLLIGIALLLCVLIVIKQARAKKEAHEKLVDLATPEGRAIACSALTLAGYLAVMNILGFLVSTLAFSLVASFVMGYRKKMKLVVFALVTTVCLFLLFGKLFFVPLPRGIGILRELSYLLY